MCIHCSNINNNNIAADYSVNKNNGRIFSPTPLSSGDGGGSGDDNNQFLRRVCYPVLWIAELRAQDQRWFMESVVMGKIRVQSAHQMQKYEWWRHLPVSLPLMSLLRSLQAMPNWGSNNHYFHDNTMYVCVCAVHVSWQHCRNHCIFIGTISSQRNRSWIARAQTNRIWQNNDTFVTRKGYKTESILCNMFPNETTDERKRTQKTK